MKTAKKILALILSTVLIMIILVPAVAAGTVNQTCPEIYVPGFMSGTICTDKNNPETANRIPDKDEIIEAVKNEVVPAFIAYAADGDADKLGKSIADVINEMFEDWFNNHDGSAKGNAGVSFTYPSKKAVASANRTEFRYDWRGDVMESAEQLNDYINYVLECTGKDKVALTSHSLGTVVVLTYLSIYGNDKVMGIVFDSPAINGLTSVGELFSRRADFDAEGIAAILKMIMGTTEYEELLSSIVDIFTMAGINGMIADFLDNAYQKVGPVLMIECLFPLFGCWPSVWAMVPDEYIDEAMNEVFEKGYFDESYNGLKTRIENYNQKVRANKKQTILDFDAVGRLAVISRYGYNSVPVMKEWTLLSDAVIDTKNSSFGATTAKVGEYFSDEYLADKDMKYISPDRTVDASTCLFPEKTWFIKDLAHDQAGVTVPYFKQLLFSAEEATCDNSSLPRFTIYNSETGEVTADESVPVKAEKLTVFDRIFNFIKALINKLFDLFRK